MASQPSGSKKRKFGIDDPRTFPASQFNKSLTKINMPFLKLRRLEEANETINKFYGGRINPGVLAHCQKEVLDPFLHDFGSTYTGHGELQTRINLGALPVALRRLLPKTMEEYNFKGQTKQGHDSMHTEAAEEVDEEHEQETPPDAAPTEAPSPESSPASAREFTARHEDNRYLLRNQAVDLVVEVMDKNIHIDKAYSTGDAFCASLVIDGKDDDLRDNWLDFNCWQTGFYGYYHCLNNITKGRTSPVNFGCVSEGYWASGCIVPEGSIVLEGGGQLTEGAVKDFLQERNRLQQKTGEVEDEEVRECKKELDAQLAASLSLLRNNFAKDKLGTAHHDNGTYLVGTLYHAQKVYAKRTYPAKIIPTPDEYAFSEGLLRSCLGDRVLDWTSAADVDEVLLKNDERKRKAIEDAWSYHKEDVLKAQWPLQRGKFV